MIDACRACGVKLMIGHSRRFTARYQEIRRAIDAGELGEVRVLRENERRSRPQAGQDGGYWHPGHWTGNPEISVGAALTNGIHETDLLRWFADAEPLRVFAETSVTRPGNVVPDFITMTITFANGALGSSEVSNCLPPGHPFYHQIDIYGTRGALRARDTDQQGLIQFTDEGASFPKSYEMLLHFQDAYTGELSLFVRAVREDSPLPLAPEASREALKLALAAVESARTGKPIDLGSFGKEGGRHACSGDFCSAS